MVYEMRRPARRVRALPRRARAARWSTSTSTGSARSGCGRAASATTADAYAADQGGFRVVAVPAARRRPATSGCAAQVDRFPFVPDDDERASRSTATRPTTSRCPGSSSGCAPSAAATRPGCRHRHRRLRRPRLHPRADRRGQGDGPARPAAHRHPRLHDAGLRDRAPARSRNAIHLMESLGITWEELDIRPAAEQMLARPRPPVRPRRGGLRRHLRERAGRAAHRLPLPARPTSAAASSLGTGDLSELALGWCTYGVGDQMSHYGVNTGVPKTLMQHLIRWVVSSAAVRGAGQRHAARRDPRHRDQPRAGARPGRARRSQSTEDSVGPYALQDFTLFHVLRRGYRPSKIAFLAEHAWADADAGRRGRRATPRAPGPSTTSPTSGAGWRSSCRRFFANQFKRSAIPNGPKVVRRRLAVAARRLADAVRRRVARLARRARRQRPRDADLHGPSDLSAGARHSSASRA